MCRGASQQNLKMYICEITSDDELDAALPPARQSPVRAVSSLPSTDGAGARSVISTNSYAASQSPMLASTPLGHRISNPTSAVRNHPYHRRVLAHHKSVPGVNDWQPSSLGNHTDDDHRTAPLFKRHSTVTNINKSNTGNHNSLHSFSADGSLFRHRRNSLSYGGEFSEEGAKLLQQQEQQNQWQAQLNAFDARRHWRSQISEDDTIASSSSSSLSMGSPSMTSRSTGSDTDSVMHGDSVAAPTPFSVDDILDNTGPRTSMNINTVTGSSNYDQGAAYAMEARMAALTTADRPRPRALSDAQRRAGNIMSPATARSHWGVVARRRGASTSATGSSFSYAASELTSDAYCTVAFAHQQQKRRSMTPMPHDGRLDSVYEVTAKLERGLIDAAKVGIKLPTVPSSHRSLFYNTFSGML